MRPRRGPSRGPDPGALRTLVALIAPLIYPLATTGIVFIFVIFILMQQQDLRNRLVRLAGSRDGYLHNARLCRGSVNFACPVVALMVNIIQTGLLPRAQSGTRRAFCYMIAPIRSRLHSRQHVLGPVLSLASEDRNLVLVLLRRVHAEQRLVGRRCEGGKVRLVITRRSSASNLRLLSWAIIQLCPPLCCQHTRGSTGPLQSKALPARSS